MNICVLGNSHAASLKNGWDEISYKFPGIHLTFFASRKNALQGLVIEKDRLVPNSEILCKNISFTSGGINHVDLEGYDIFLVYALGLTVPNIDRRCSSAVVKQSCIDSFSRSLNSTLCKRIRLASKKPILIGHTPQRAISAKSPGPCINQLSYIEILDLMNKWLTLENSTIIGQPIETLIDQWHTNHNYSIDSTRLDVGDIISGQNHPDSDCWHMNNNFGKLWLENFFQSINNSHANPVESSVMIM